MFCNYLNFSHIRKLNYVLDIDLIKIVQSFEVYYFIFFFLIFILFFHLFRHFSCARDKLGAFVFLLLF